MALKVEYDFIYKFQFCICMAFDCLLHFQMKIKPTLVDITSSVVITDFMILQRLFILLHRKICLKKIPAFLVRPVIN